jgi:glycosyltransferase involved in cell wall biosynthesis
MNPLISICIPAYKHVDYLERLLKSIAIQTYTDFEVVITDDSPDNSVQQLCESFKGAFELRYHKNITPLGSPENWNAGVRLAKGRWIKIMHDDDWFSSETALETFYNALTIHANKGFIFSGYRNVYPNQQIKDVRLPVHKKFYLDRPERLICENVIGPPSATIYKKDSLLEYDKQLKWLVDIDYYIRYLKREPYYYIDKCLINIGISAEQVTQSSFRVAEVEIPEHFHVIEKLGSAALRSIAVYDAFWRLMRNLNIRTLEQIVEAGYKKRIPPQVESIIAIQNKIPRALLQVGIISKLLMALSYSFTALFRKA